MIVDDSDDFRAELTELLTLLGYEVVSASSGRNALHYLTSDKPLPALVLLDLEMPDINGWDLMNILQSYLKFSSLPIAVLSARELNQHPHGGRVVRYLRKPIKVPQLLALVKTFAPPDGAPPEKKTPVNESVH